MSTRKTWVLELAARCRRVGWRVERQASSGGYKVYLPDGNTYPLHMTASDGNAYKNAIKNLEDAGLAEAEDKLAAAKDAEKRARLDAARAAAEAQARKLAAQAKATRKAAGPYGAPEIIEPAWFLEAHPAPWMRWAVITPELAELLLGELNTDNRPLNESRVDKYAAIITSNQWRRTHQGVAIDTTPVLQDGQHRLAGIVKAGIAVPLAVFVGMDPQNFKAIDEGLLRQAAQLLAKDGEKHTTTISAIIKMIDAYGAPQPLAFLRSENAPTNQSVYDRFAADATTLRQAAEWARAQRGRFAMQPAALGALRVLLYRQNGADNPYVKVFLHGMVTGLKIDTRIALDADDPRLRLAAWLNRKKLERARTNGLVHLAMGIKTWNYVVDDVRKTFLRYDDMQTFPIIKLCQPGTSAPPPLLAEEVELLATLNHTGEDIDV